MKVQFNLKGSHDVQRKSFSFGLEELTASTQAHIAQKRTILQQADCSFRRIYARSAILLGTFIDVHYFHQQIVTV